jgi:hypothetical protein
LEAAVIVDHTMLREIKIADIRVGQRHRREMGDLTTLAASIRQEGLLQPIGVTDRLELVFGERRLLAYRDILKRKTIPARVVNVSSILAGEYHENEVRKNFTPSERVAIGKAIERQIGNRRGQRTDQLREKIPEVAPGKRTREAAAEKAGFGNDTTYRQAAKVVEQLLIWHACNHCSPKSRRLFKQTWQPILLYRRSGSTRAVISAGKQWDGENHNLDCYVAPVPQTVYQDTDLKQHPCQKPVAVMRWLIHALSEPGEMVCSPFCGVAPCGIAATQLGRRYHGIEASANYRRIAERRIAAYGQCK